MPRLFGCIHEMMATLSYFLIFFFLSRLPMFDFLFKKSSNAKKAAILEQQQRDQAAQQVAKNHQKKSQQQILKQAALDEATNFEGQEAAALAFIANTPFADARLVAAQHIKSQEQLTALLNAVRNTDRRVAKYAQEKLSVLQHQDNVAKQVALCVEQAHALLAQKVILVNQVLTWKQQSQFLHSLNNANNLIATLSAQLETRLEAQMALQQSARQVVAGVLSLATSDLQESTEPLFIAEKLAQYQTQWQAICAHDSIESLPKNLQDEFVQAQNQAQKRLSQLEQAWQKESAQGPSNQTLMSTAVNLSEQDNLVPQVSIFTENLNALSIDDTNNNPSEQAIDLPETATQVKLKTEKNIVLSKAQCDALLDKLNAALDEGSLQQALEIDKTLRSTNLPKDSTMGTRFQAARAELARLLDWAKWGGNVSREELIKAAETLLENHFAPAELAKQIGGLRARWKELERTSGASAQAVWNRFDAACNRAYEVAAAHFKQQAEMRELNYQTALAQLAAMDVTILTMQEQLNNGSIDWKQHSQIIQQSNLAWRQLGMIDRRHKNKLEAEFNQKIASLMRPLKEARMQAVAQRKQLIASVVALNPRARSAVDVVQQAQQTWQQQAILLPLDRRDEQVLWKQFRVSCDAVFAERKAQAEEIKQQRNQVLQDKHACCEELEQALIESGTLRNLEALIKKTQQQWTHLSQQQTGLETRFNAAIAALKEKMNQLRTLEAAQQFALLHDKITLCEKSEAAIQAGETTPIEQLTAWQNEWAALPPLTQSAFNKALNSRFEKSIAMLTTPNSVNKDKTTNASNKSEIDQQLLRLEILQNLPSPVNVAQQRLQLQVAELQTTLKEGSRHENPAQLCAALLLLPVAWSTDQRQRMDVILKSII